MRLQRTIALAVLVAVTVATVAIATHGQSSAAPELRQAHHRAVHAAARARKRLGPLQRARLRAVAWARAQRGMHEVGTTNCSPAIDRWMRHMGLPVPAVPPCRPWCGAFVHEAFHQAGIELSARVIDPNQSYWDAMQHENGLKRIPKADVAPGDLVFFSLSDPNVQATHEEIVLARPRNGKVLTAGGNVGHHAVVTRRGLAYIVLAARVTATPRWSRAAARPAQGSSSARARAA
jgi:cell wall-associated NlpC family hydrolase